MTKFALKLNWLDILSKGKFFKELLFNNFSSSYGLSWSNHKEGYLLSSANDAKICLWNIEGTETASAIVKPFSEFKFHSGPIQDVAWHNFNHDLFASVGDDRKIAL